MTVDPAVVITVIGVLATGLGTAARMVYQGLRRDIDDWKAVALASTEDNRRLTKIIERDLGIKIPPAE